MRYGLCMKTTLRANLLTRISALAAACAAAATVTHGTAAQLEAALGATLAGRLADAQATVAQMEAALAGTVTS
jgi:hypothetical protein